MKRKPWKHPYIRQRGIGWILIGIGIGLALAAIPGPVWATLFLLGGAAAFLFWYLSRRSW